MFPDAPATFDEFLAQLAAQMARMDSLMQSLSPEMRHQLEEMISATFGDPDLQAQLAELMGGLELLSDRRHLGQRYSFFGNEQLPFDEAMGVMDHLQSIEELERGLRGMYRGEPLDSATEEALRDVLGDNAARDLSRLQRMTDHSNSVGSSSAMKKACASLRADCGASDRKPSVISSPGCAAIASGTIRYRATAKVANARRTRSLTNSETCSISTCARRS